MTADDSEASGDSVPASAAKRLNAASRIAAADRVRLLTSPEVPREDARTWLFGDLSGGDGEWDELLSVVCHPSNRAQVLEFIKRHRTEEEVEVSDEDEVIVYDFPGRSWMVDPEIAQGLEDEGMVEPDGMGGYEVVGDPEAVESFIHERE